MSNSCTFETKDLEGSQKKYCILVTKQFIFQIKCTQRSWPFTSCWFRKQALGKQIIVDSFYRHYLEFLSLLEVFSTVAAVPESRNYQRPKRRHLLPIQNILYAVVVKSKNVLHFDKSVHNNLSQIYSDFCVNVVFYWSVNLYFLLQLPAYRRPAPLKESFSSEFKKNEIQRFIRTKFKSI